MFAISTLTLNPCIDKSTAVEKLLHEKKLHCDIPKFEPGGGGINVARAIKKLGGKAMAIYPSGGYSGKFLNELLKREEIPSKHINISVHTRENLIVMDKSDNQQYRFGMPGPTLKEHEWKTCLEVLKERNSKYIVVSGNIPQGVPDDVVARIAAWCKLKNKKLIVDTSGPALSLALEEGVFMIKPNIGELSRLVNEELTIATAVDAAKKIIYKGQSEIIVVSLGEEGALLVTADTEIQFVPPAVKKLSSVGAGDSMVAGIVYKISQKWPIQKAVQFGVACGTAATLNAGTELCHLEDAEELFTAIEKRMLPIKTPDANTQS